MDYKTFPGFSRKNSIPFYDRLSPNPTRKYSFDENSLYADLDTRKFLPTFTDKNLKTRKVVYKKLEKPLSSDFLEKKDFFSNQQVQPPKFTAKRITDALNHIQKALLNTENPINPINQKLAKRRASVQERINSFEKLRYDPNSLKRRIKNEDGDVEGVDSNGNFESSWDFDEKPTSVREKIADFERRSSIDSDQGSCISISLKTPKNRIYPFETLKIDPILQNTHLLDEKFAEIRKIFGPNEQIGERIIPIRLLNGGILKNSSINLKECSKMMSFVSGLGRKREPKSLRLTEISLDSEICLFISLVGCEQIEEITCLMAVQANRFHLYPRFPGVYLNLDVQEDLMSRRNSRRKSLIKSPSLLSEPQFNADPTSDEYLTPEEDEELIRFGSGSC